MKRLLVCCMVIAIGLCAALTVAASPRRAWVRLGARSVTDRVDHDVVTVGAKHGHFSALKIMVQKRAVEFRRVKVTYANDAIEEIEIRDVIPAGGETRVIDLKGGKRTIRRIDFWYDAQSLGGKAKVVVWGRH